MPSQRRIKIVVVAIVTIVFLYIYSTSDARQLQNQRFYRSTVQAMDAHAAAKDSASDDSGLFRKLQPNRAQPVDREALNKVNQEKLGAPAAQDSDQEMQEISVAGRAKMQVPKPKPSVAVAEQKEEPKKEEKEPEPEDDPEIRDELNGILKMSPIIIFSKSYCPYSAKAKNILLEKYKIVPAPFVVELDLHPLGQKLQLLLARNTGRKTVPNILVNGLSIGGGDDIAALDQEQQLGSKLKSAGQLIHGLEELDYCLRTIPEPERVRPTLDPNGAKPKRSAKRRTTRPPAISLHQASLNFDPLDDRSHDDNDDSSPLGHFTARTVKMRYIHSEETLPIPDNGKLVKDLSHIAVTFGRPEKNIISIELHHGARKGVATLRTVRTIINNLIIGVTRGFKYKMRYVYAHFPINVNIEKNSETGLHEVEIRNFLGEKIVRRVTCQPGVEVITSPNVKDELQLSGNSLEGVSQSAADIQQICRVRNKDIRKFLDGLYVSERGNIIEE
ncbi:glutaredoxin domain protein [Paecilomyces variotii No. 5]|uniref:Glutaredoxin domain protein n=1 Tax=Byssochlamys spectabilis (strain No. 5 / NBRC 109023) TaxID=1356009 RepID=V5FUW0_BYSSN|nr:glutaredoxin domain protein [Paecilomyces variotii No. 5]